MRKARSREIITERATEEKASNQRKRDRQRDRGRERELLKIISGYILFTTSFYSF